MSEEFRNQVQDSSLDMFSGEYKLKGTVKQGVYIDEDIYYLEVTDAYDPNEIFIPGFEFTVLVVAIAGVMLLFRKKSMGALR